VAVTERATLVGVVLALVGMVFAIGAGPVAAMARRAALSHLALVPLVGLALVSTLLTSATAVMTLDTAAYAVLVPAMALSAGAAVIILVRRRARPRLTDAAIPLAIAAAALLVALGPGLSIGSAGPYTGVLRDAWWYVAMGDWLRDHTVWDTPADSVWLHNLLDGTGWVSLQLDARLGLTVLPSTMAQLLGTTTEQALYPVMVLLFALLPPALWASARVIGLGKVAATVAALLGMGALPLSLVLDTAVGNLAGLIFAPLAIAFGIAAVRSGGWSEIVLAAIFAAGLVASYPEFVPPTVLVAGLGGLWVVVRAWRRRRLGDLIAPARRVGMVAAGLVVLAPFATVRLFDYLLWADGATSAVVDRGLSPGTIGAWASSLMHTYELGEIATMSWAARALLILGPLLMLALAVHGATVRRDAGDVLLVLVPVVVAVVLGAYVYRTGAFDGDECQYCLSKALTFAFPSAVIGVGAGVQSLVLLARSGRRVAVAVAVPCLAAAVTLGVGIALGTQRMAQDFVDTAAYLPPEARALAADGERLGVSGGVFIEGIEAAGDVVYFVPALYQTVTKIPGAYPVFDMESAAGYDLYLIANPYNWGRILPRERYEDPTYRYVLSAYSGLDSGREVLARHGRYALERRAPVDVTVNRTGPVIGGPDRSAELPARPVVTTGAQLRVAAPAAGRGHVIVTAEGAETPDDAFFVGADTASTPAVHSVGEEGSSTCFAVDLERGFTSFGIRPAPGSPGGLTITATRAAMGPCPAAARPVVLPPIPVVGGEAFPQEPLFSGEAGQWLGTRAFVDIVPVERRRPATLVRLGLVSFVRPQTATVTLDGRVVGRIVGSMDFVAPATLEVRVPAGLGAARLRIVSSPGALPATEVNPSDPRRIAIALETPVVRLLPDDA
jgi:hypothetical protein